jgi:alanine racemase
MLYQTHARIHLGNIRRNLDGIRAAVGPARKILVAVKANGYGHGAVEVSRTAAEQGVDWLGVATVPEGLQLRRAGIELPILKLSHAFPEEMEAALAHDLTLAVCDLDNARRLQEACRATGRQGRIHLKLDTGMGRIGLDPAEAPAVAAELERTCPALVLEGVFTHLPVSDAADPAWTRAQIDRFGRTVGAIERALGRKLDLVHCANSGGVLAHPAAFMNMVRPGIMVYGFRPDPETPATIPLHPGLSLLTRIAFLKRVARGTPIGYGHTWTAPQDTWIATIPAGYADGFNRLFSNRGRVLVGGRSFPVVGRVCMDQSMVDLGPETSARVGDRVTLLGRDGSEAIPCEEWARVLGTITYEVTCQINGRVERICDHD